MSWHVHCLNLTQSGEKVIKKLKKNKAPTEAAMSILIVDDEKDMGRLLSDILKEEGYKVNSVYDGKSALSKIKNQHYDMMILDYNLSGMTGFNVLEQSRKVDPNIKTIMISAYGDSKIKRQAKEYGVDEFLDKPFDINNLLETIKKSAESVMNSRMEKND